MDLQWSSSDGSALLLITPEELAAKGKDVLWWPADARTPYWAAEPRTATDECIATASSLQSHLSSKDLQQRQSLARFKLTRRPFAVLYEPSPGLAQLERSFGFAHHIRSLAWSPDGDRLAVAGDVGLLCVLGHEGERTLSLPWRTVFGVAWSPNGTRLAAVGTDSTVVLWDTATWELAERFKTPHGGPLCAVAWSPDGSRIAVGGVVGYMLDAGTGKLVTQYGTHTRGMREGHQSIINTLAWNPDGSRIASGDRHHEVHLWDADSGQLAMRLSENDDISALTWSPDGERIAIAYRNRLISVRSSTNGMILRSYMAHRSPAHCVTWAPDGKSLASGDESGVLHIWEAQTGRTLTEAPITEAGLWTCAWSPDGSTVAAGDVAGHVRLVKPGA